MHCICKNCFLDNEIIGFIVAQSEEIGKCSFCNSEDENILNIEELFDFFQELFDNFQLKGSSDTLKAKIQNHWNFFSSQELANNILNYVIPHIKTDITSASEFVDFSEEIKENVNYWNTLKEQLKWERRFLTDVNYLTEDLGWDGFFGSKLLLDVHTPYYRARLHHSESLEAYMPDEMYCPPNMRSTAGRANPAGIPFLYLSDNEETILYEIRAAYLDEVTIGSFYLRDTIKSNIIISDFTQTPTIFHPSKVNEKIKSKLLKDLISRDLSKPLRRYDSELDYIPTQFICEFIKVYTGVHGIKFRSSLHSTGNNLVIFDQNIMECKSVEKIKIRRVIIEP